MPDAMEPHTCDLIIIGAGPGGYETAVTAAKKGMKVTIIEQHKVGGTCLNEGCIPTKTFYRHAALLDDVREAALYGIQTSAPTLDFAQVAARKNEVVKTLQTGVEALLQHKNIQLVYGTARFEDEHTVSVEGECYRAPHLIIATGSVTKFLPIEGLKEAGVLTSKEMLETDHVPPRLCIIGAGVIGMEFASIFHSFGSKVTVIEYMKEILPAFDSDIAKRLKQTLTKKGIEIVNQGCIRSVKRQGEVFTVEYEHKKGLATLETDKVLLATGRIAHTGSLNLDDVHIDFTPKGITVNEFMQTSVPHIYAIGDVNGLCMLAHAATFQGLRALHHILGEKDGIRLDIMPAVVFTRPEVASVGLTEEQCKASGIKFTAKKAFYRANGKAVSMNETEGLCKLLANEEGLIIGAHIMGAHASDLIQEICALMNRQTTIAQLKEMIHPHPTLCEIIQTAAHEF